MTQEEFKQYSELQNKFTKDVFRVAGFLKDIDMDFKFVDDFQLIGLSVETHGVEHGRFQYREDHYGSFKAEMLTWSDEQLREYVDDELKKYELECIAKVELSKKQKEEEGRKEFERLKAKYGKYYEKETVTF